MYAVSTDCDWAGQWRRFRTLLLSHALDAQFEPHASLPSSISTYPRFSQSRGPIHTFMIIVTPSLQKYIWSSTRLEAMEYPHSTKTRAKCRARAKKPREYSFILRFSYEKVSTRTVRSRLDGSDLPAAY